ncbi:MAG: reductase, partial [Paucimonas sp.]|nr:reductase [Paucimonas sp.]
MHIEESVKLDFKDVLIRPKRSTLPSRSQVDIQREFSFYHSKTQYHGIPIIAANMDTTGTMEMARALGRHGLSAALHKHYPEDDLLAFFTSLEKKGLAPSTAFYSMGIGQADYEKFSAVMKRAGSAIRYACIDVANGYTESFIRFVKRIRDEHPDLTIMAGNVVT